MPVLMVFCWLVCLWGLAGCKAELPGSDWTAAEWSLIQSMALPALPAKPSDASNRQMGNPEAAALGAKLFFDPRLSRNGKISCASCHQPDKYFSDGLPVAQGIQAGVRNTPSLLGVAYNRWFFWDGRKDSLWSQALSPLEDSREHDLSRTELVHWVLTDPTYGQQYAHIFGALPERAQEVSPVDARPSGTIAQIQAWKAMDQAQQLRIDTGFSNIGKVIAAYVVTLAPVQTRFDRYVAAIQQDRSDEAQSLLSPDAIQGLRLFIGPKAQCINCHSGPLFTNQSFHHIGTSQPGRDSGRAAVIDAVRLDRFNCLGAFSDAPADTCAELRFMQRDRHALKGAYKTPGLRNVGNTAPYFHDGSRLTLEAVMDHYMDTVTLATDTDLPKITLDQQDKRYLLAFLRSLSADSP